MRVSASLCASVRVSACECAMVRVCAWLRARMVTTKSDQPQRFKPLLDNSSRTHPARMQWCIRDFGCRLAAASREPHCRLAAVSLPLPCPFAPGRVMQGGRAGGEGGQPRAGRGADASRWSVSQEDVDTRRPNPSHMGRSRFSKTSVRVGLEPTEADPAAAVSRKPGTKAGFGESSQRCRPEVRLQQNGVELDERSYKFYTSPVIFRP